MDDDAILAELRRINTRLGAIEQQGATHTQRLKDGKEKIDQMHNEIYSGGNGKSLVERMSLAENKIDGHESSLAHMRTIVVAVIGSMLTAIASWFKS